jgi:hypothetical protein
VDRGSFRRLIGTTPPLLSTQRYVGGDPRLKVDLKQSPGNRGFPLERMIGLEPTTFCMARPTRQPQRTDTARHSRELREFGHRRSDTERQQATPQPD